MISRKHFLRCLALSGLAVSLPTWGTSAKRTERTGSLSRYRLEPHRDYKYPPSFLRLSKRQSFASVQEAVAAVRNPTLPFSIVKIPT